MAGECTLLLLLLLLASIVCAIHWTEEPNFVEWANRIGIRSKTHWSFVFKQNE